jgi:hypothetical protein
VIGLLPFQPDHETGEAELRLAPAEGMAVSLQFRTSLSSKGSNCEQEFTSMH